MVDLRREVHRRPELAFAEHHTTGLIRDHMRALGIEEPVRVTETGGIFAMEGGRPGRSVVLRADIDALPVHEDARRAGHSEVEGVMHACGHDVHTAVLIGAARLLLERRAELAGRVKLMFQPAEEGGAGALRMIEDGLLQDPPVDAAFMLHVAHALPVGRVATAPGPVLAGANSFTISVEGRGGHASRPHTTIDPIVVGAQVVTALQTLVSREAPPDRAVVVTLGSFQAGSAANVIPDRAVIKGTIRAYDADLMKQLERRMEETAAGVAAAMRATAAVKFHMHYPPTVNDPAMAELLSGAVRTALGPESVGVVQPIMAAEDFSFVLQRVAGAMLSLGVHAPEWEAPRPVHTARFDVDEAALPVGVACMAAVAMDFLES
jgi:amidohydrolase